ncbi:MAG: spermidine/putrescine ABC transporter substrate-binding protein [Clostridia bacterium]|nr:spermidine/putrescine ABC transporter substrate-binding protein [Clostridia bacterium]
MKNTKKLIFGIFFVAVLIFSLFSCSSEDEGESGFTGETHTLNVYNWGEYISDGFEGAPDTNKDFEEYFNTYLAEKYGFYIQVNYTTYANNEEMYTKLKSGAGIYDIVVPSDYMIQKMISEDMLLAFDVAGDIENYVHIDAKFKGMEYDPNEQYTVPYTYGMLGVIYNENLVDEEDVADKSWGLLWNEKYKGKILQFNNPRDAFGTAMYYKGLDINSIDTAIWQEAFGVLSQQKPLVQGYVNDEIFNKMTTASAAIAPYYAGDYLTMAAQEEALKFYYPTEGTNFFVDAFCIPKNSREPEVAKEYINFMLNEEAGTANALYVGYACPNNLVKNSENYKAELADYLGDEAYDILYGTEPDVINAEYMEKYGVAYYKMFSPEIQSLVNTLWEGLKTENSTELWVHITSIAIVVGVLFFAIYDLYIKKKRSKDYRLRDKMNKKKA